ncbi:hypothetical protein [Pectobacterium polaris]|uniref:hypothetical protein n=1 Tax=Pectobacterium polaris TaxID=2042057 RepID=UPI001583B367
MPDRFTAVFQNYPMGEGALLLFAHFFTVITEKQSPTLLGCNHEMKPFFGNGVAYDYPDRGIFNPERKIS